MDTRVESGTRRNVAAAIALLAVVSPTLAADRTDVAVEATRIEPNVRRGVMPDVALKIRAGFTVAISRATSLPQCGALFRDLGADPVELLGRSLYYPAAVNRQNPSCKNGVQAFTPVGTPITWVCDRFGKLSTDKAALVLLHEALHFAGLPEQPHDPNAMTSSEINDMVKDRCGHSCGRPQFRPRGLARPLFRPFTHSGAHRAPTLFPVAAESLVGRTGSP
jgi:hypothetical protein